MKETVTSCLLGTMLLGTLLAQEGPRSNEAPEGQERSMAELGSRSIRVHDPSTIMREGEEFWLFHTGRGVASAFSKDLVEWVHGPRVFMEAPKWAAEAVPENRRMHYWAPDIIRMGDEVWLYYSVSSFGKNHSVIALAKNKTLDFESENSYWRDEGIVMRSFRTNDFNAIDPALTRDEEGRLWMSFGSFWGGIKMVELDRKTGKRVAEDAPIYSLAWKEQIEAPFIYHHGDYYYLFLNWGFCCRGTNSTYNIRVGRSEKITGPYLDREGTGMMKGGGTLLLETEGDFIGPGHPAIFKRGDQYWMSMHFYDGTRRGMSTLAIRPLRWRDDGWPEVERAE